MTCKFCHRATVLDDASASLVRERATRHDVEALYATLGAPPTVSQKIAVALTNGWLWIVGAPFMLALFIKLGSVPKAMQDAWWEAHRHERLLHVASPMLSWLLGVGWQCALLVGVLVWSLFGERIDARRDLQAALASKPPKTDGGPATCRNCDAALDVKPGDLGVRCAFCGADNLVQVPESWARRAEKIDRVLRLNSHIAQQRAREGARQVRAAARWRVPFVLAIVALLAWPAWNERTQAGWSDFLAKGAGGGVSVLAVWHDHDTPTSSLRSYARCADENARVALHAELAAQDSQWCAANLCTAAMMFALRHGDRLRLTAVTVGAAELRVALGGRDYESGVLVLDESFGDEVVKQTVQLVPGQVALEATAPLSGWYKVQLRGAPEVAFEPCVAEP